MIMYHLDLACGIGERIVLNRGRYGTPYGRWSRWRIELIVEGEHEVRGVENFGQVPSP